MRNEDRNALNKKRYGVYAQYRDKFGYTDYYISKQCEIPRSCIADWKKGLSFPSAEKLLKLCDFLDMPIREVVNGE